MAEGEEQRETPKTESQDKNNAIIIGVVVLIIVAILGFIIYQNSKSPVEKAADEIQENTEDIEKNVENTMEEVEDAVVEQVEEGMEELTDNLVQVAVKAGTFNTLLALATQAGLAETLANDGPFTILAPNDDAFQALPQETVTALTANPEALREVLTYHVIPQKLMASDLTSGEKLATVNGKVVTVTVEPDGTIMFDDAKLLQKDVVAKNGNIFVIDKVLVPAE